jgi:hypothetical protein
MGDTLLNIALLQFRGWGSVPAHQCRTGWVRWETTRPPSGKTLVQLASIADQAGFEREAEFFRKQLRRELGERAVTGFLGGTLPDTEAERVAVGTLLAMRHLQYQGLVRSTIAGPV